MCTRTRSRPVLSLLLLASALGQMPAYAEPAPEALSQAPNIKAPPALARLTIGAVFPLTGPQAAFGLEARRGIEMAISDLAATDPELAQRVTVVWGDDHSSVQDAATAAQQVIEQGHAQTLIGSVTSATTMAVATVARRLQVPLIAPMTPQPSVSTSGGVYRGCMSDALEGQLLAEFALSVLGVKEAATLREAGATGQNFVARFAEAFTAGGGKITEQITYDLATEDFSAHLKHLQASGAKFIATPAAYYAAANLFQQAKTLVPELHFLGSDSWDTPTLVKTAGAAGVGNYFITHFAADDTSVASANFVKKFREGFGRAPGTVAALSYDATNTVIAAFRQAKTSIKSEMAAAIGRLVGVAGVTGNISYAGNTGEALKTGIVKHLTATEATFKARVTPLQLGKATASTETLVVAAPAASAGAGGTSGSQPAAGVAPAAKAVVAAPIAATPVAASAAATAVTAPAAATAGAALGAATGTLPAAGSPAATGAAPVSSSPQAANLPPASPNAAAPAATQGL